MIIYYIHNYYDWHIITEHNKDEVPPIEFINSWANFLWVITPFSSSLIQCRKQKIWLDLSSILELLWLILSLISRSIYALAKLAWPLQKCGIWSKILHIRVTAVLRCGCCRILEKMIFIGILAALISSAGAKEISDCDYFDTVDLTFSQRLDNSRAHTARSLSMWEHVSASSSPAFDTVVIGIDSTCLMKANVRRSSSGMQL